MVGDGGLRDTVGPARAARLQSQDLADAEVLELREVGVSVTGEQDVSALAGGAAAGVPARSEGERFAVGPCEHDVLAAGRPETGDGPGVGPGPGLDGMAWPAPLPGPLEEYLRDVRLCGQVEALGDEEHAGGRRKKEDRPRRRRSEDHATLRRARAPRAAVSRRSAPNSVCRYEDVEPWGRGPA